MAKTVPESKFTEWKGLDRIARVCHEMKCIFREISKDDFGLDGEIEVVAPKAEGKGYETTGRIIKVQAKSGASYIAGDSETSFSVPVRKDDLDLWYRSNYPVLFIIYHPGDDGLYCKEVKSYVRSAPDAFKPPLRIVFDKATDVFNAGYYDAVCKHADVSPPRLSFNDQERLFCNLLPVRALPLWITSASTDRTEWARLRAEIGGAVPPFLIAAGRLYGFSDMSDTNCALGKYCGRDIRKIPASEWADDELKQWDFVFLLNQLLGLHCWDCGIRYNREFGRNYFPREDNRHSEFKKRWHNVRTGKEAPPRTVAKYYEYGAYRFWRHLAAEFSFRRIGKRWFLQLIPKYLFTDDGRKPCEGDFVGPYTTRMKAKEHNSSVLNHILFWADTLSRQKPLIGLKLQGKVIMSIEKMPLAGLAPFAIPSDPATYEEKAPPRQLGLFVEGQAEGEEYEY